MELIFYAFMSFHFEYFLKTDDRQTHDRRMKLFTDLFLSVSNPSHKLYNLLPDRLFSAYNTRHRRVFNMLCFRTDCFKFSFIPAMCACANLDF